MSALLSADAYLSLAVSRSGNHAVGIVGVVVVQSTGSGHVANVVAVGRVDGAQPPIPSVYS